MRDDFGALFAATASLRRDPTPSEVTGGIPCGPFSQQLLNELFFANSSMLSELNTLLDAAGIAPDETLTNQLLAAVRKLNSTAVALGAARLLGPPQLLTTAGNLVLPAGFVYGLVEGVGGGGGGAGTTNPGSGLVSIGGAGTAGTWALAMVTLAQIQAAYGNGPIPYGVGMAGQGGVGGAGTAGGPSYFGSFLNIPGGKPGGPLNAQSAPTVNGTGNISDPATGPCLVRSRSGTAPVPGVMLSATIGFGPSGGDSAFGAGGYGKNPNSNGAAGTDYGGGGAGAATTAGSGSTGGNGSPGALMFYPFGILQS